MNDISLGGLRRRRCYLVRHGHVSYFDADGRPLDPRNVPLSSKGLAQAQALGRALSEVAIDRAVCSDYPRARQTLDQLLVGRTQPVAMLSGWREIRAGRLRDIPEHALQQEVTQAYALAAQDGATFLRGEGWESFQARILAQLNALLADPDWSSALIVSHDAVNRILLAWATGAGLQGLAAFEQDHACLNVLDIDMDGPRVVRALIRTQNFTPYDPVKTGIGPTVMEHLYSAIDPRRLHA
ncbi:histidine phosphatase family protein [Pseudomonas sp. H9]|uniref:histidine phosphatase family protein n=1 Tax=Pseudomonas sp. H9 TaxID=483968 RepID=UPI001058334F|nr:histidine phosphatase family protein [Pseudomonas sp. H9]TDF84034.1 histidine phosphatase family protein [Pseudomonas sp. H9]